MKTFEKTLDFHQKLNPKLWDGSTIRPDVRKALLNIALEYYKFLKIKVQIIDIVISGSQANYNYTEYSDIDLHLIVDYSDVKCDMEVDELFDTKRNLWKEQHDISIHDIPVELYAEDVNKPAVSSKYSLIENDWINKPKKITVNVDDAEIKERTVQWIKLIKSGISAKDLEKLDKIKDLLWDYRKAGLKKYGEFGVPNLVFKNLRNIGATEILITAVRKLKDSKLSLENMD